MIRALGLSILITATLAPASEAAASARRGQAIAKENCAACHAIGRTGKSPLAKAPPLRVVATKYPLESLEEAFAEGIVVSHRSPEMPPFEMEPQQIADLMDFLRSLQPKKKR